MKIIRKMLSMSWRDFKFAIRKKIWMKLIRNQYGTLGKGSCIEKELMILGKKHIYIGSEVFIRPGARIEAVTEFAGKKYAPKIVIGNRVNIEQNIHMTCAELIEIEDHVTISSNVLITDINHSYQKVNINPLNQPLETKEVHIGSFSLIGSGAKIMPGVKIGKNVVVGANAVVTEDVPDYCIVAGIPAKIIKHYDFEKEEWVHA